MIPCAVQHRICRLHDAPAAARMAALFRSVLSHAENPAKRSRSMTDLRALPSAPAPVRRSAIAWLNNQPYLLLSLTSLFWAGNIVIARYVGNHVPPLTLSCLRWLGTSLILLPF